MDSKLMEKQVASKKRVTDYGEVYTGRRKVNAMLDLVKQETERIDSHFQESACGTGNFLTAILERKLGVVELRYGRSQLEYERNAFRLIPIEDVDESWTDEIAFIESKIRPMELDHE